MTSITKNDVPIRFARSESDGIDDNENNRTVTEKTAKCMEPSENSKKSVKKVHQKRSFGKRWLFKLSMADVFIGLLNISFGMAVYIERKKLPHWLTDCAFSIWYGCFVSSLLIVQIILLIPVECPGAKDIAHETV